MSRTAIGLDLSTHGVAWAVVDGTGAYLRGGEVLVPTKPKLDTGARLRWLYSDLVALLWRHCPLGVVAVEEANYVRNAVTQRALVTAIAYAELAAAQSHLPCETVHNAKWKAALGVKLLGQDRQHQKAAITEAVTALLPPAAVADGWSQDRYDAVGIARYAALLGEQPAVHKPRSKKRSA